MLIENAIVIDYKPGLATVKCQSQSACGACSVKTNCGTSALSKLTGEQHEHIFNIETITPLKIGQRVEIGLSEYTLLQSIGLVYILPLLSILISTIIGNQLFSNELFTALFIFISTGFTFFRVSFYAKKVQKKSAFQPILIKVLH